LQEIEFGLHQSQVLLLRTHVFGVDRCLLVQPCNLRVLDGKAIEQSIDIRSWRSALTRRVSCLASFGITQRANPDVIDTQKCLYHPPRPCVGCGRTLRKAHEEASPELERFGTRSEITSPHVGVYGPFANALDPAYGLLDQAQRVGDGSSGFSHAGEREQGFAFENELVSLGESLSRTLEVGHGPLGIPERQPGLATV
jgi:hypothetical protein